MANPKITFILGLVLTVAVVGGNVSVWSGGLPDNIAKEIAWLCSITATFGVPVMTYLTGKSSSVKGPLT